MTNAPAASPVPCAHARHPFSAFPIEPHWIEDWRAHPVVDALSNFRESPGGGYDARWDDLDKSSSETYEAQSLARPLVVERFLKSETS